MKTRLTSTFTWALISPALAESVRKLDPRVLWHNPVILLTELGAALCTLVILNEVARRAGSRPSTCKSRLWLWFTVLFANFAEALAEGRGKAQAETLKKARTTTLARRLRNGNEEERVAACSFAQARRRGLRSRRCHSGRRGGHRRHRHRG